LLYILYPYAEALDMISYAPFTAKGVEHFLPTLRWISKGCVAAMGSKIRGMPQIQINMCGFALGEGKWV